ncbi:MAG: elongation factor G [Clostridia bacterium]|nr:elongation factor G [Clostridia bacterium]
MDANKIRNVAIIGHSGEGKTTLCEAILFNCGAIERQGKVEDGNTCMDFDAEEIAKKSSIGLAIANCEYKGYKFNLIDVPGYYDFECEMAQALAVSDSAIIVSGANGTLTVGTEKAIDYCVDHGIPAILFLNGLDKDNSDFIKTVDAIKEKYGHKIAPMIVPNMVDGKMKGFVKVAYGVLRDWERNESPVPDYLQDAYETAHLSVMEAAAENDEELLNKYFSEGELTPEEIEQGVKLGIATCSTITVLGGSAFKNHGVFNLMDKIISTLPSPIDAGHQKALQNGEKVVIETDENSETIVRVFKTVVDPYMGKLHYVKVISGVLKQGQVLKVYSKDSEEKISSIYLVKGKKQEAVESLGAGDIGALAKLDDVKTGDTLYEKTPTEFKKFDVPAPMYKRAVYALKKGEEDKIFAGLNKLADEDISFSVEKNKETGEMIIAGLGTTQLSVLSKKLKNKFGVEVVLKAPKIAYKETILQKAEGEGKHKKQSGGAGQYGHAVITFEPGASDGYYEFVDAVVGGVVPKQFIPAVDKGLREAINHGVLAGYPLINLKATLHDGSSHSVDSKEVAYVSAAKLAYEQGIKNAKPVILEPIYQVKVVVPDSYLGDIMGDINKRRGRILGTEQVEDKCIVTCEVPEIEILEYAQDLRSLTQAKGFFSSEFVRYEEVPFDQTSKIIEQAKKQD